MKRDQISLFSFWLLTQAQRYSKDIEPKIEFSGFELAQEEFYYNIDLCKIVINVYAFLIYLQMSFTSLFVPPVLSPLSPIVWRFVQAQQS